MGMNHNFYSVAMQIAASEAQRGHERLTKELRFLVDIAKRARAKNNTVALVRPVGDLATILSASYPQTKLNDMVLHQALSLQIERVIREHRYAARILEHGLSPRRKLLLVGKPGTGKTLTASVLAGELGMPLFQVRLDGLITKFMGETAAKLRQVFDATGQTRGVYFFDEFDAIGSQRGLSNDVGEIRRILNSFLQMIEQDSSNSLIVAATNHPELLDHALFRRFDDVLVYELPDLAHCVKLLKARLGAYTEKGVDWKHLAQSSVGMSHAELTRATQESIKDAIVKGKSTVSVEDIGLAINERKEMAKHLEQLQP